MALSSVALPLCATAEEVAVLDVVLDGVPQTALPQFEASLDEGLRGAGFEVLDHERVADLLVKVDVPAGCSFGPCMKAIGATLRVPLVLVARVTAEGPSYSYVLTLVDTMSGVPVAQVTDRCAVCTFDEAISSATLAVVELGTKKRDDITAPALGAPRARRAARHAAWWMTGLALAAGGAGAYFLYQDQPEYGWGGVGAGGAFAVAGITLFAISRP